jgi:hypothetical protein
MTGIQFAGTTAPTEPQRATRAVIALNQIVFDMYHGLLFIQILLKTKMTITV